MTKPLTVAIIGAGHRSMIYASFALKHPEAMKVVAVGDPNPVRRKAAADAHAIPAEMQFDSHRQMLERGQIADAIINGTMDKQHYETSLPFIQQGYHLLLEKPIAAREAEVRELIEAAGKYKR